MNPERWKQVKLILEEVIEIPPDSRSLYLDEACVGDEKLRREVEVLLGFDDTRAGVLEQTAFSAVMKNGFGESAKNYLGKQIGNYRIISELGAGGMGAVYLAERADGAFEQRVALKIVKRGMDSDAVLRRFFNERQILAALEHPNIAHLIDGGTTDDGTPYFVMEYVEGETIIEFAEQSNLGLEEKLKLFREVCAAVTFAHSNLVIHRDLKPSNILVTKDRTPKLLDFGIAKLLKSENAGGLETATQSFVFTPEYASPEQVRGEKLTTSTDVYSLGVILYELLTGNRPYKTRSRNISEIIRAVCETEPIAPSRVWRDAETRKRGDTEKDLQVSTGIAASPTRRVAASRLRGDLDNIVLKALRKEPEDRYSSVEQFSEDVRRHLEGLPIKAGKGTWSYRASKFVQRNRLGVAAASLVLLTLLGGLAATLYQANVARHERARAEQRFNDVRQLANSFLFEFHDAIKELPGSTPARKLVVSRAIEYLDKLATESNSDPTLQRELATAYEKIGKIQGNSYYPNLGDSEGAMRSYRRSLEIRQQLAGAGGGGGGPQDYELQNELADGHEGVGDMLYTFNDLKAGLQSYENALSIREKLTAAEPDNLKYRNALAGTLFKRGDIKGMEGFPNLGDTFGALESYRRAIALIEELVKAEPDNQNYKAEYGVRLPYLGMLQATTGDAKNAIISGQKSVSILERLIAADPNNTSYKTALMSTLSFLRFPLLDEGRTSEAIENARRVIQTLEGLIAVDPKNAQLRRNLSVSYNNLGKCLLQTKDAAGAMENHRRSLAITEGLYAADPNSGENRRDVSMTKQFLAEAQIAAGEYEAALSNLQQSVSVLEEELKSAGEAASPQTKDDLAVCLREIGKILAAKGDLTNAAGALRRAMPLSEEVLLKAPLNIRAKSRHATLFFEAGKTLERLARNESGEKREAARRESCDYFKHSFDIWNEMRQAGTLSAINAARPDEAAKELAGCE